MRSFARGTKAVRCHELGRESVQRTLLFNYRKFLKSSEIVYNGLEIKNDMTKERM